MRVLFVGLAVLGMTFAQMASAGPHYVAQGGQTPETPFTTWVTAASNIQDAINVASASDTVLVSNGVYQTGGTNLSGLTNRVYANKDYLVVRSANNDPTNTIIKGYRDPAGDAYGNGPAAVRGVSLWGSAWLIGFTVTNCATLAAGEPYRGGGVTGGYVSNCILTGNSAGLYGGGAYGCTLRNCTIVGNKYAQGGGGASHANLYNCTLSGNYGGAGGGAFNSTLYNCLLTGNSAGNGGGVQTDSGATLYNCTIVGNQGGAGGGVRSSYNAILYINNCIIYSNDATSGTGSNYYLIHAGYTPIINFTNSCTSPTKDGGWADGNITNDPIFVAYGNGYGTNHVAGNYRLQANSPCVNTGTNGSWTTTYPADLDGRRRIDRLFGRVDMGAYEFIHKITLISGH